MEKVKPRTLSGFMELLPAPQVQMERIMQVLRETYALYGFYPLDTPCAPSTRWRSNANIKSTRTPMKTVTIYTDGIKTAMRFYR